MSKNLFADLGISRKALRLNPFERTTQGQPDLANVFVFQIAQRGHGRAGGGSEASERDDGGMAQLGAGVSEAVCEDGKHEVRLEAQPAERGHSGACDDRKTIFRATDEHWHRWCGIGSEIAKSAEAADGRAA